MSFRRTLVLILLAASGVSARDSSGRARARIELLPLVELKHDLVRGKWEIDDGALVCTEAATAARVMIPYLPPEEYELVIVAERTAGKDALILGLANGTTQFVHVLDGYTAVNRCLSGFEVLDGKPAIENESARDGRSFTNGTPCALVYSVRRGRVGVRVNGEPVLDWKGDFGRLSVRPDYRINNPGALFVGSWMSTFRITRMTLFPYGPPGRRLRD